MQNKQETGDRKETGDGSLSPFLKHGGDRGRFSVSIPEALFGEIKIMDIGAPLNNLRK